MLVAPFRIPVQKLVPHIFDRSIGPDFQIDVKVGEVVKPENIIAIGWQRSGFRTFMLGQLFSMPAEKVGALLQKTIGSRVYEGDVLAQHSGLFGLRTKVFRSPLGGILSDYDKKTGRLTLQYLPTEVRVTSGVYGKVTSIVPGEYVRIATQASLIKGVIGFGADREGSLVEIGYPDIPLLPDNIMPKHKGKIIFGGTHVSFDTLYKALSIGVRGVITGGMQYTDYLRLIGSKGRFEDIGISLLITEGFGGASINNEMYEVLKSAENRQVYFEVKNANLTIPGLHDEVVVDQLTTDHLETDGFTQYKLLEKGMTVRLLTEHSFGEYGIVADVGTDTELVTVSFGSGSMVVNVASLEIVGLSTKKS